MRYTLTALLLATPTLALADPGEFGHMGYGYGTTMLFGPLLMLIVIGLIVAGVVWALRQGEGGKRNGGSDARAALDLRFARGEVDAEDYAARKKLLSD